jgi:hypothetical protein
MGKLLIGLMAGSSSITINSRIPSPWSEHVLCQASSFLHWFICVVPIPTMAPTILVAGATGNTGQGVVKTLSELLKTTTNFSGHRILALIRSSRGAIA